MSGHWDTVQAAINDGNLALASIRYHANQMLRLLAKTNLRDVQLDYQTSEALVEIKRQLKDFDSRSKRFK